uniref:Uncharacterized protein n=1 Tax=Anguilla anguilla TaxID=7936 RepID=A0A0E9U2I7_ANGAN
MKALPSQGLESPSIPTASPLLIVYIF